MKVAHDSFLTSGLRFGRWRRGSSLLEVQIAFALLGIGLAGLCPFVVMQLKQLLNLESRFMATSYTFQRIGAVSYTAQGWPPPSYYTTSSFIASSQPAPQPHLLLLSRSLEQPLGAETDHTGPVADDFQQHE